MCLHASHNWAVRGEITSVWRQSVPAPDGTLGKQAAVTQREAAGGQAEEASVGISRPGTSKRVARLMGTRRCWSPLGAKGGNWATVTDG